jgi:MFS family permease
VTVRQIKVGYFVLEGLNSFATSFYFYYLFFFMQRQFGFGNLGNLSLAALNGFIYTFVAWFGGSFGQRFGYFKALGVGFTTLATALLLGTQAHSPMSQVGVLMAWSVGICFIWPTLEALVSEQEDALGLQQMIGIYNLVWAASGAVAYFFGGMLLEHLGLRSLFWIPAGIHLTQISILLWLLVLVPRAVTAPRVPPAAHSAIELNPRPIARARSFLRMAWLANPFGYVAINTVVAVVPSLARELGLSSAMAGVVCSTWLFARMVTFLGLWLWTGWHYRMRWFLSAYLLLILSFGSILLFPNLPVLILAQITLGYALGLLYYSSLYYSMAAGDTKGEHGGLHEAAIGAGVFAGPAIGASALHFLPEYPNSSTWAVGLALCGGLVGLLTMARRRR